MSCQIIVAWLLFVFPCQNAAAHASAAFDMEVDGTAVKGTPVLVVGGGKERPMNCPITAKYLEGKHLLEEDTLKGTW